MKDKPIWKLKVQFTVGKMSFTLENALMTIALMVLLVIVLYGLI